MTTHEDGTMKVDVTPHVGKGDYTLRMTGKDFVGEARLGPRDLAALRDAITETLEHR